MNDDELLDKCIARLNGEYRCLLRPNGSVIWVKAVEPGWMPVTENRVLQALRGVGDHKALAATLNQLHHDSRVALLPGEPMPELSEEPHGKQPTYFFL